MFLILSISGKFHKRNSMLTSTFTFCHYQDFLLFILCQLLVFKVKARKLYGGELSHSWGNQEANLIFKIKRITRSASIWEEGRGKVLLESRFEKENFFLTNWGWPVIPLVFGIYIKLFMPRIVLNRYISKGTKFKIWEIYFGCFIVD